MKLKHDYTQVNFKDEYSNFWTVRFTGEHGNIMAVLYQNDSKVATYKIGYGHANKTRAISIIKNYNHE